MPPQSPTPHQDIRAEWLRCHASVTHFVANHVHIYNATTQAWLRFDLWPAQAKTLEQMAALRLLVILKARQLGLSWLSLAYALWLLIFAAPSTVLLFSLREAEAVELLTRLIGMYDRLPRWMQARRITRQNNTTFALSNGSRALAFSTKGGRSYTATLALVDEADYVPDLNRFLSGVKPTIDAGGKLFLVSTSDKSAPVSTFKNLYRAALAGVGDYEAVFLPWSARPDRDAAWHARTQAEMFAQQGSHDAFYAEYPSTPEEALAPEQSDRRIPYDWLLQVYDERTPIDTSTAQIKVPAINGLDIFVEPQPGRHYVIGADPAEGNPNSDDSAACVLDALSWEEVANLAGKFEPHVFAEYLDKLSAYYNHADVLVERNNHGHTVIRSLQESGKTRILPGYDGKPGWLTNIKGKPLAYDLAAEAIHQQACIVHSAQTASQVASIEASTLSAPVGLHDDRAMAFVLAIAALAFGNHNAQAGTVVSAPDPLDRFDEGGF